ncbi:hypothetical protein EV702DRAFT_1048473 [Suillus placidus]|uniref:Uncharacterized protein n=1 Tax=Suillus placidus TaxID=48579 RepID=A0A9P6ZNP6_9AGAM|nr:hypothetical protein EV702DRAFT_1048473 [Suillus placidus]
MACTTRPIKESSPTIYGGRKGCPAGPVLKQDSDSFSIPTRSLSGTPSYVSRTTTPLKIPTSPPSSDTPYDSSDDDIIGPITAPPAMLRCLSDYVKSTKPRPKPYQRTVPNVIERLCGEECSGCTSSKNLPKDQRESTRLQHRLKSLTPVALAHAVVAIQADIEWRQRAAIAAALHVDAVQKHSKFLDVTATSEADTYYCHYKLEETSFVAADVEFDHFETIVCSRCSGDMSLLMNSSVLLDHVPNTSRNLSSHATIMTSGTNHCAAQSELVTKWPHWNKAQQNRQKFRTDHDPTVHQIPVHITLIKSSTWPKRLHYAFFQAEQHCIAYLPVYHCRPLRVKHELNRASVTEVCSKTYYASSQLDLNRSGINANLVKLIKLFRGRPRVQKTIALVTKWLTGKAAQARASGVHQITEKVTNQATYRHISRPYRATALPSIVAPDNSHLQVPADGGYVNLQSQSQVSTGNVFNQQPPTTNQSEYHGLSNIINNVPHGPTPTGTFLYPTPHDPSTGQAAFLYGRYNVSDIWPAHDASAYSDHQPPCSQTLVGSSYNSLAQSEPPSTFQQAYNQYPQDGSSNLNATQIASQEPAFPPTSLYPTPSNPSTSQVASAYGYRDSQPAAGTSSDQPPYLQGLAGGSYNNLAQSELPSSVASVFQQAYSRYLQGGSFNASLAQSTPQGPAFPPTSLYPTPSNPSTSQVASAYSYRNSQPAASTSNDQFPYLQDPAGSSYNSLAQSEPLTSTFQQAHSQYLQGRSSNSNLTQSAPQGPAFPPTFLYPTPSNPSASQVTSAYGYRDSQPAAGTSYDQPPRLQDPAGGSYNLTSQQCVDEVLHDGSSNVAQNAPKVPTLLPTVLDPSMSQAGSNSIKLAGFERSQLRRPRAIPFLRISRWHYKNGQEQTDSPETRTLQTDNFYQLSEVPFLSINAPLINVKLEASRLMNMSLIRETLYPTKDKNTELADAALAGAITNHTNVDNAMMLEAWKLRAEGQGTLTRLKGTVKQIHKNCQGKSCARGAMAGAYNLSVQLLLKKTEDIIPSRKLDASALLLTRDFLDTNCSVNLHFSKSGIMGNLYVFNLNNAPSNLGLEWSHQTGARTCLDSSQSDLQTFLPLLPPTLFLV